MEVNASSLEKEASEVVLNVSGVECQSRGSSPKPNTEPIKLENPLSSSQISNLTSPSALELTQSIPTPSELPNIQTRKSISRASASEDAVELEPSTSQIGLDPSPAVEEEDDEDECKTVRKVFSTQWVAFACIIGLLIASLTIRNLRNIVIWHVHLWGWCLLMWAIFCGKLAADRLITLLVFLFEKKYLPKKKVFYFLFALKDSAEVFAWLCLVILAWVLLINHGVKCSRHTTKILNRVTRALVSCLIGWLIKSVLITSLAVSFQHKRFFNRMQDYLFQYSVIRKLSGRAGLEKSLRVNIEKLIKMEMDKVSPWKIVNLANFLDEVEQQDKEMTDGQEAKDAAKKIFKNVAKSGRQFIEKDIEKDDLLRFMPEERVEKFLDFFPGAKETGKIRKLLFKIWLENVRREQKSVIRAFKDTKTCIDKLDNLASALSLVVIIILGLLLTGLLTTPVQIFISSQLLLLEFIFGNAAKDLFEAIVFVFVKHPFDVGDRCVVNGVEMEVAEMNILTTVFLTNDGEKKTYPNSVLASKPISNFNKSPPLSEYVEFKVDFSASDESLVALKDKIKTYLDHEPAHWHPDPSVVVKEIVDGDHLKMVLHVSHTMNFPSAREKADRRSKLVLELKKILEELHIKCRVHP